MAIVPDLSGNYPESVPPLDTAIADGDGADGSTVVTGANGITAATAANPLPVTSYGDVADGAVDTGTMVVAIGGKVGVASPTETIGDRVKWRFGITGSGFINIRDDLNGLAANCALFNSDAISTGSHGGLVTHARGQVLNPAGSYDRQRGDITGIWAKEPALAKTDSAISAASTTSQQLFAANTIRSKVVIQNQDALIMVYVNIGAAAVAGANNLRIAPGEVLELAGTTGAVNIIAASGTPAICAWQF